MADKDHSDDEYKFEELNLENEPGLEQEEDANASKYSKTSENSERKNTIRNALIVVGLVVFAVIAYKLVGWMLSSKKIVTPMPTVKVAQQPAVTEPVAPITTPAPVIETQPIVTTEDSDLKQKVSSMDQALQTVRADVSSVQEQISTVNNNVNVLNTQLTTLNQTIANLSAQVAKQSEVINTLIVRVHTKPIPKKTRFIPINKAVYFYIQAVIPGRAWLIDSNGSTLTVREGTKIPRYGIVKLIDSMQGRILTSSGRVIRFSQDDS